LIDKLDSLSWTTWKFQIKHFLLARDCGAWSREQRLCRKMQTPRYKQKEIPKGFFYNGHGDKFISTLPDNFV